MPAKIHGPVSSSLGLCRRTGCQHIHTREPKHDLNVINDDMFCQFQTFKPLAVVNKTALCQSKISENGRKALTSTP